MIKKMLVFHIITITRTSSVDVSEYTNITAIPAKWIMALAIRFCRDKSSQHKELIRFTEIRHTISIADSQGVLGKQCNSNTCTHKQVVDFWNIYLSFVLS